MARSSTDVVRARGSLRAVMATGDLGDARLNARRNGLLRALEQSPDVGFPEACADGSETEALYRFLRNRRVSLEAVLQPHLEATGARCRALDEVLVIHDTTEMSFPGEQPRKGLTQLGPRRHGFWFHAALAVSARPETVRTDRRRAVYATGEYWPQSVVAETISRSPERKSPLGRWRERRPEPCD